MNSVMIVVVDGCAPEYLTKESAPTLYSLAEQTGFSKRIQCAMPSVTNVNHACILSGKWPEETGVTGNYFYDPVDGREGFIEEKGFMKAPTLLERYRQAGGTTALLTVKGKVLGVYGHGATIGISAQAPDEALLKRYNLAPPPAIQSVDSTRWILNAAFQCIRVDNPHLVYCTTNDYIFHHYPPGSPEANRQISALDEFVGRIHAISPERQIYVTADHGMNAKTTLVNFQAIANRAGFDVYCLPPLKDRYIENHIYQEGGMLYVYVKEKTQAEAFFQFAQSHPLVEQVLTKEGAAHAYHLPLAQIGDYVLLAGKDSAFGEVEGEVLHTRDSRTHGSLYEREIPLIALHPAAGADCYRYNVDIAARLFASLER